MIDCLEQYSNKDFFVISVNTVLYFFTGPFFKKLSLQEKVKYN